MDLRGCLPPNNPAPLTPRVNAVKTKSLLPSLVAVCAAIAILTGNCFGNGPAQHHSSHQKGDCEKGGKHCACEPIYKSCFWEFCKPHAPPFLPVIQSLGVRNRPPATDADQLQLSVEMNQMSPDADQGSSDQGAKPTQKDAHQKTPVSFGYGGADVSHTDERFRRLESQVDLLLKRMDEVLQRETKQARQIEPQIAR